MAKISRTLEAGTAELVHTTGRKIYFVSGGGSIEFVVNGKSNELSAGQGLMFSDPFTEFELRNNSVTDYDVVIYVGEAEFVDNRVVGSVTLNSGTTYSTGARVSKLNTQTLVVAAVAGQSELHLKADPANTGVVWTGGALYSGIGLEAGDFYSINSSDGCVLYFEGDGAVQIARVVA